MIHLLLFSILFILAIIYEITRFNKGKNLIIFSIIFIFAFAYQMGGDWLIYQDFYEYVIPNISFLNIFDYRFEFEKGFVFLNFLFYNLGFNYEFFMGIILSFCIYILLNFIYRKSENYYLSIYMYMMLYLFATTLEPVVRQLIAISVIICGIKYIEKRKFFYYLLFIGIAFSMHKSASICIFLYFLPNIKINIKKIIPLLIFCYIIVLNIPFILNIFSIVIPTLSHYKGYFYSAVYGLHQKRNFIEIIYHIVTFIGFNYIIFYGYKYSNKKNNFYKNMAILYLSMRCFVNLLPIFSRLVQYLTPAFVICMGAVGKLRLPNNKIIKLKKIRIGFLYVFFICLPITLSFLNSYYNKIGKFRYFTYKNYFIEMVKGSLKENFKEKSKEYKKINKKLLEKN